MEFSLPDAGEGLTEAEIVAWRVHAGDEVDVNTPLVEIETAKSLVELPSPVAGVVAELLVGEGDLVAVGTPIIRITEAGSSPAGDSPARSAAAPAQPAFDTAPSPAPEPAMERQPVLVGYGPRLGQVTSRRRPASAPLAGTTSAPAPVRSLAEVRPLAKPPIRKLARDLGVDLRLVQPSGPGGVITRNDVRASIQPVRSPEPRPVDPADGRRETRTPIRGVRRATAQAMVASAFTAPQVTIWLTVDVTRSMRLLRRQQKPGGTSSPLVLIVRALLLAVQRHPEINASWDEAAGEIVTKHYVDVGIAAATPRGLMVPVIRDAQHRSVDDLTAELTRVVTAARDGSATPADLQGGTITVTNFGVFGVDGGTPILPPGQSAILGVGQIAARPWVHRGRIRAREILQLTLSFDHRLVDGDLGSRFLADVGAVLEHPDVALLWG